MDLVANGKNLQKIFENQSERIIFGFLGNLRSEHTKVAYRGDLLGWVGFLRDNFLDTPLVEAVHEHLVAYRNYLERHGGRKGGAGADKTVNRKMAALMKFYRYLCQKGIVEKNPVEFVDRLKVDSSVKTMAITREQAKMMIECPDAKGSFAGSLHKAVLAMLFTTGMRKGELMGLLLKDLKVKGDIMVLEYTAKGNRKMVRPLSKLGLDALMGYLKKCRENSYSFNDEDFMFRPTRVSEGRNVNKKLQGTSVDFIFKKYAERIGLDKRKMGPHVARATVVSCLYEQGVDIKRIKEIVGHAHINMTVEYIKRERSLKESEVIL